MAAPVSEPEVQELFRQRRYGELRRRLVAADVPEIADIIEELPAPDDLGVFRLLPQERATEVFEHLEPEKQRELIERLAREREWLTELLNEMSPDDRTALLEELPGPIVQRLISLLTPEERRIAVRLLGYPEDSIGRLMTTEYVALRPHWTVRQALDHIRRFGKDSETLNVVYVVDDKWRLLDDLKTRELLLADPDARIADLMDNRFVALRATDDQETAVEVFREYDRVALPVVDSKGVLLGIVTVDDVLDVAEEEATEDIQKIGGSEALDESYLATPVPELVKKRARWLIVLFLGEMLTATAMRYFEEEIARAVVLALFVPLIISSGGNSGSQATTLIIRAMSLGEVRLRDWWRVMFREAISGLSLGLILGAIGFARIAVWHHVFGLYGEHWILVGIVVAIALVGVVLFGTLAGSMLPFLLRRLGADPATASAPFVATLVDVTGVLIYFGVAAVLLRGSLL
ncbi:MAG: magnesium transporter [Acidobacteria bacterium]|nr:MAG: magnesium transporter [Acidobacteriota bacterium]